MALYAYEVKYVEYTPLKHIWVCFRLFFVTVAKLLDMMYLRRLYHIFIAHSSIKTASQKKRPEVSRFELSFYTGISKASKPFAQALPRRSSA